jgi:hypothetical protein
MWAHLRFEMAATDTINHLSKKPGNLLTLFVFYYSSKWGGIFTVMQATNELVENIPMSSSLSSAY